MANATTIRPEEAAHFGKLAKDWWNPKGSSAMLHRLNPLRLAFLREAVDAHWRGDSRSIKPLAGKCALDVGCGAGLLCEPLARLGAQVTGIDAAAENVEAARVHAGAMGLAVDYRHGDIAALGLTGFDFVIAMEVLEHVADKPAFVAALAAALAPNGLLVMSTPNRTVRSRALLVEGAERLGAVPRGTHRWGEFVTPGELRELFAVAGLRPGKERGIAWSPAKGLHLSDDLSINYMIAATMA
jgi:2-polyprenyl-6-hydroxyphenyl methylase/3-demethylubiquinone-9 3-methyltransferase